MKLENDIGMSEMIQGFNQKIFVLKTIVRNQRFCGSH